MYRTKQDIKYKKYGKYEDNKLIQRVRNGGSITNYQGYGLESSRGCFCCGGKNNLSTKHCSSSKNTATWKRAKRSSKKRQRRLNKISSTNWIE